MAVRVDVLMISARFTAPVMRVMLSTTPTSAQVCEILTNAWNLWVTCTLPSTLVSALYHSSVLTSESSNTLLTWIGGQGLSWLIVVNTFYIMYLCIPASMDSCSDLLAASPQLTQA